MTVVPDERVGIFMADWAQRLADWMLELLPDNVAARAKLSNGCAVIQLTARRNAEFARYAYALNVFIQWQTREIVEFLCAPIQNTIEFQARVRERLVRFGEPESIDFQGGSQNAPSAIVFGLSDFGVNLA